MTPEKQRLAIACHVWRAKGCLTWANGLQRDAEESVKTGKPLDFSGVPDYLNDLNAMHRAEEGLLGGEYAVFARHLAELLPPYDSNTGQYADLSICHTTAAQRAEALLKTVGLWEKAP